MSLYSKARKLARKFTTPEQAAEHLEIDVIQMPLKFIKGIAVSLEGIKLIFVDSNLSYLERQIVIGHELGHFYLHPSTNFVFILQNTFFHDKHEYQANRFSCELLLGEKAEKYKYSISEVCARGRLDKLVEFISFALEDEVWTP